ncbi:hypothetical protein ACTFIZ_008334 [Dictyostelium cf. discoideum]
MFKFLLRQSIVYQYGIDEDYYSKWSFALTGLELEFNCVNSSVVRTWSIPMDELIAKKLHGQTSSCLNMVRFNINMCGFVISQNSPTPIIEPEFRPPTKGGNVLIQVDSVNTGSTNLTISYLGGCGPRSLIWNNGNNYTFNHASPSIQSLSVNDSLVLINGDNFCNVKEMVDIFMDEIKVDKQSIELVDHEIIKLNYNQQYCKSVEIKVVSGGLVSNVFKKEFKPNPIKINTVPSDIGCIVTIEGQRLSSSFTLIVILV